MASADALGGASKMADWDTGGKPDARGNQSSNNAPNFMHALAGARVQATSTFISK
jgi:hypothetical protein